MASFYLQIQEALQILSRKKKKKQERNYTRNTIIKLMKCVIRQSLPPEIRSMTYKGIKVRMTGFSPETIEIEK